MEIVLKIYNTLVSFTDIYILFGSTCNALYINKKKVKWSRYRPGVAQRVGRGIALLFHYRGTRRGWVVSSTPRPHFTPRERPGTHFTGGWVVPRAGLDQRKNLVPSRIRSRTVQPGSSVAIPTELPGPLHTVNIYSNWLQEQFCNWTLYTLYTLSLK